MAKSRVSKIRSDLNSTNKKIKATSSRLVDHLTDLPQLLQEGVDILQDEKEKEVFFVGALGVASGILPNVSGIYNGDKVYANLYVYILANYGSGKGVLKYSRMLGSEIHQSKIDEFKKFLSNNPMGQEGKVQDLLFLPANTSKTGLTYLMAQNNDSGIVFETESDTLANALNGSEHGKFSDILRKAFQHESCDFYRSTSREHIEIRNPRLSTILSSTYDQLVTLIPTYENGLFSRFLFYTFEAEQKFAKVFDSKKANYYPEFINLASKYKNVYDRLNMSGGIGFQLSVKQEKIFQKYFEDIHKELTTYISKELSGTVYRLGLICFRICMILTSLRMFENVAGEKKLPKIIKCSDDDLQKAISLIDIFKQNSIEIFFTLEPKIDSKVKVKSSNSETQKIIEMKLSGMSFLDISKKLRIKQPRVEYLYYKHNKRTSA